MGDKIFVSDAEYEKINQLYDECLDYLKIYKENEIEETSSLSSEPEDPGYETIKELRGENETNHTNGKISEATNYQVEDEINRSVCSLTSTVKSERLRKLSQQLPKIIITKSNNSIDEKNYSNNIDIRPAKKPRKKSTSKRNSRNEPPLRHRGDFPKRLVSKNGSENVALISNVPFEKIRLLNDTFHTLINLRWRWIVIGTVVMHFAIWLVFAVFWYITALAHYDFEPEPPSRTCITGGKDFVTIFLASVEAQTTIGFGDRAIDEECPESIFLFIMQLILGTGLSGVLTCVVYAKLTRPEKLSRDGVGFSKKAVICMRDGHLCLMMRAWDLNYDHIICSEFTAHYICAYKTKEGETIRYYACDLALQQRQFLLWPVTLVHVIDHTSPLYRCTPESLMDINFEITVTLKGASASMGTFTQSQTSYLPREIVWGYRFPPVVKYNIMKQKYVIEHSKLDTIEAVHTPYCSAYALYRASLPQSQEHPETPGSFSDKMSTFQIGRISSFKRK
ncbi:ATP-sensitive inward rectifier potassium channel 10-like [Aricia agestis]|uniref:ATP-sensitive inward rectifier potassium channel 10-like n=1 Tax=Aricia agestis TaxID=91739 RepID=UPI001C201D1B|nr:ATP-sensitive inward rectifier potassium channel 10-like [Aricia agestis]